MNSGLELKLVSKRQGYLKKIKNEKGGRKGSKGRLKKIFTFFSEGQRPKRPKALLTGGREEVLRLKGALKNF